MPIWPLHSVFNAKQMTACEGALRRNGVAEYCPWISPSDSQTAIFRTERVKTLMPSNEDGCKMVSD